MIGSLADFMPLEEDSILAQPQLSASREIGQQQGSKRRGKSAFESYTPDDKTDLLVRYERNNIYSINRKRGGSIAKEATTRQVLRKPLVQHRSFFVKPEIAKDYIAKEELKRKHNLLRAILRMKQNEEEPNKESDYEQSFQRLYAGFRTVHPLPVLTRPQRPMPEEALPEPKKVLADPIRQKSQLGNRKRLQYEHCLQWAKKHNKHGEFFEEQLGRNTRQLSAEEAVQNRSLLEEIGRKVSLSWLE